MMIRFCTIWFACLLCVFCSASVEAFEAQPYLRNGDSTLCWDFDTKGNIYRIDRQSRSAEVVKQVVNVDTLEGGIVRLKGIKYSGCWNFLIVARNFEVFRTQGSHLVSLDLRADYRGELQIVPLTGARVLVAHFAGWSDRWEQYVVDLETGKATPAPDFQVPEVSFSSFSDSGAVLFLARVFGRFYLVLDSTKQIPLLREKVDIARLFGGDEKSRGTILATHRENLLLYQNGRVAVCDMLTKEMIADHAHEDGRYTWLIRRVNEARLHVFFVEHEDREYGLPQATGRVERYSVKDGAFHPMSDLTFDPEEDFVLMTPEGELVTVAKEPVGNFVSLFDY